MEIETAVNENQLILIGIETILIESDLSLIETETSLIHNEWISIGNGNDFH